MPNPPGPKACPTNTPRNTSHQTRKNGHSGRKSHQKAKEARSTCSILACTPGVSRPKSARLRATTSATAAHIARAASHRQAAAGGPHPRLSTRLLLQQLPGLAASSPPGRASGRAAGPAGQGRRGVAGGRGSGRGRPGWRCVVNFWGGARRGGRGGGALVSAFQHGGRHTALQQSCLARSLATLSIYLSCSGPYTLFWYSWQHLHQPCVAGKV